MQIASECPCSGFAVKVFSNCAKMLLKTLVLVSRQQSVFIHSCLLFTFPPQSRLALELVLNSLHACLKFSFFYLLPPPPLLRPSFSCSTYLSFSMCNLKLICTTGYLTGATDTESVIVLTETQHGINIKLK